MSNRNRAGKHHAKARRKRRAGPRKAPVETTLAIIDRLFRMKVTFPFSDGERKITAIEAIMHQLMRKQADGDVHASRVLQKYEELAPAGTDAALRIAFVENDYTQTLAAPESGNE